ncbi:MAG: RtcB family protein [Planctomycetes bacterium]|nr:RtcB family protein [Planctomycetota bacterium]
MSSWKWNPDQDHDADPVLPRRERRALKTQRSSQSRNEMQHALEADARVAMWLASPLDVHTAQALIRLQSLPDLQRMAIMPDVHPAADVCVGCVLGTAEIVYPAAIGGDIGCGMSAIAIADTDEPSLADREAILKEFNRSIDVARRSHKRDAVQAADMPDPQDLVQPHLRKLATGDGVGQLGTLGRGNHFVELQRDESGTLWLMVHSGSRFMGQAVAGYYDRVAKAEGVRSMIAGLRRDSEAAVGYLADQTWCVRYATANRMQMLAAGAEAVQKVIGGRISWKGTLDVPHNFIAIEGHNGSDLVIHRKGAAPAHAGSVGLIPGSAGTMSVHVVGKGESASLASSSHGAGRTRSRSDARHHVSETDVRQQMKDVTFDEARSRAMRDEAPSVYRDLRIVMEAQRDLVTITRILKPLVSFKATGE